MKDYDVELLAEQVLDTYSQKAPVDLARIAVEEGIELVEGDFGDDFHGRLEFLPAVSTFAIYHPQLITARYPGRVRFSIAHELGHYFIDEHREGIINGLFHNSAESFDSKSSVEHEADTFASALLIPTKALRSAMGRNNILTLEQILDLSRTCDASAQATAFRYVRFAEEPCLAIVSKDARVLYAFASEDADARGFKMLGNREVSPESATRKAAQSTMREIFQGPTSTLQWFSDRGRSAELWEEATRLGSSALVLTLLSWKDYERDD